MHVASLCLLLGAVASRVLDDTCMDGDCLERIVLLQTGLMKTSDLHDDDASAATSTRNFRAREQLPLLLEEAPKNETDTKMVSKQLYGADSCKCIGIALNGSSTWPLGGDLIDYPTETGTSCQPWDDGRHPICKKSGAPAWCKDSWCYVDPCSCNLEVPPKKTITQVKWQGKPAFWSYTTCGHDDIFASTKARACAHQATKKACGSFSTFKECDWDGQRQQCVGRELVGACAKNELYEDVYGKKGCRCVGFYPKRGNATMIIDGRMVQYPASVGGQCDQWDKDVHPECKDQPNPPFWCTKKWCYVDPCTCMLPDTPPKPTQVDMTYQGNPAFWSYGTCEGKDKSTEDLDDFPWFPPSFCPKSEAPPYGVDACRCIGVAFNGTINLTIVDPPVEYPAETGTSCQPWDDGRHPACKKEDAPEWCRESWCYVDPCTCSLNVPPKKTTTDTKWQGKPAYWSYATCGHEDTFSATNPKACGNRKDKNACSSLEDCAWNGEQCVGKELIEACAKDDLSEERYGSKSCRCVGLHPEIGSAKMKSGGNNVSYPASLGGECRDWDNGYPPECKGDHPASWCKERWCYVDPCDCTLPDSLPKPTLFGATYRGNPAFWSYATCGSNDTFTKVLDDLLKQPPDFCVKSQACIRRNTLFSLALIVLGTLCQH